ARSSLDDLGEDPGLVFRPPPAGATRDDRRRHRRRAADAGDLQGDRRGGGASGGGAGPERAERRSAHARVRRAADLDLPGRGADADQGGRHLQHHGRDEHEVDGRRRPRPAAALLRRAGAAHAGVHGAERPRRAAVGADALPDRRLRPGRRALDRRLHRLRLRGVPPQRPRPGRPLARAVGRAAAADRLAAGQVGGPSDGAGDGPDDVGGGPGLDQRRRHPQL
ncbi:MAG: hypothetical protein AVDCRST_MAG54-4195, partial [uncultured Actinomycetospora sp.]